MVERLERPDVDGPPAAPEPLGPDALGRYVGSFRYGAGDTEVLEVLPRNGGLAIRRGERPPRTLLPAGEHAFYPVGARDVRLVFHIEDGGATSLTVHDPLPIATGIRVGGGST